MGAIKAKIKIVRLVKLYATFSVAFLFTFIISGVITPTKSTSALDCENNTVSSNPSSICDTSTTDVNVSITGAWTVSVSSAGTLGLNLTPTSSGVLSTATDNVNIYTNTPGGYQLYLNSTTGNTDIYNEDVLDSNGNLASNLPAGTNTNHFVATSGTKASPATLTNNTWGYTLTNLGDNPSQSTLNSTTFSKVELTSSSADSLISSGSKTTGAGDNLPVTYGFMADTKLTPGTYSTQVTYTAIAETPSYTISSISPNRPTYNATNVPVTILTSTPSTELGLGDITATITDGTNTVQLTNCSEITQEVSGISYRGATCTYPGGLPAGRYNVTLTSSWHNATYTLANAFSINSMQEFISTNCTNLVESTTTVDNRIDLVDSRDGKIYKVSKLADGNCWMVSNLALDGLDTNNDPVTLTPSDSNVSSNYTFPANVQQINDGTTASSNNNAQIYTSFQNTTDSYGSKYGNTYNFFAATAGQGTDSFMGDTTQSVCPKGWILPRHYFNNPSYYNLITKYLNFPSDPYIFGLDAIPYINRAQQAPLFFPLAKVYLNGMSLTMTGYTGSEATEISSRSRFVMNLDDSSSYMILSNSQFRSEADSVRCVFGN